MKSKYLSSRRNQSFNQTMFPDRRTSFVLYPHKYPFVTPPLAMTYTDKHAAPISKELLFPNPVTSKDPK